MASTPEKEGTVSDCCKVVGIVVGIIVAVIALLPILPGLLALGCFLLFLITFIRLLLPD